MSYKRRRIVIIGAGPGGLASALLLAHAGMSVTILERRDRVGGRTSSFQLDRFRFDLGPTFFLYPRVLADIFQTIGRNLWEEIPMQKLDPQYRLLFGQGGELLCSPDIAKMEAALAKLNSADAQQLRSFLKDNREKLACFKPILEMPFLSWRDLLRGPVWKALPKLRPWSSVESDLRHYFQDERIRLAMCFQSKYLGMSPFQCPSLFTILSFLEYEYGVYHPLGGCGAVSERMAAIAQEMGVRIELNADVEQLEFRDKQAIAVFANGSRFPCDALMINADFAQAMQRLVPDHLRKRWTNAKLATKQYSCSTFMIYLGIEGIYDQAAHHTIYLSKTYQQNLQDIDDRHILSTDPSIYVQNASVTDATLAPPGYSTLYILAPVSHLHPNIDWTKEKYSFREVVLNQLQHLGMPDVRERIRVERILTPLDWQQQLQVYRGATFNLSHTLRQMLLGRPRNRFEDLVGVYLIGGGTHPGSGLPVIYESARISSKLVIADLMGSQHIQDEPIRPHAQENRHPVASS